MADCYIYAQDCQDFATIGICGRLTPIRLEYTPAAGSLPELTMEHPIDPMGRHAVIQVGRILKTAVPVRTVPEIESGAFVTSVEKYSMPSGTNKSHRYVYSKQEGGSKKVMLKAGDEVIVTSKPEGSARWKVRAKGVTGWFESDALTGRTEITIPDTAAGIEAAAGTVVSRDQLFRIYAVNRADKKITAYARAIAGDAMYNVTTYDASGEVQLQAALNGILSNCIDACPLTAATNISGGRVGVHCRDKNPISAILDPEEGVAARWDAQLVIDDYDLYLLAAAGTDRGFRIDYAHNLTGIDMDVNMEDVCTHVRPVGETKDGKPLYLEDNPEGLVPCPNADAYPFKRIHVLEVSDAKVADDLDIVAARNRMRNRAREVIARGVDTPTVGVKLSFVDMGSTQRYARYRALSQLYVYDTVHVWHPVLGIDLATAVLRLTWDCLTERVTDMELGQVADRMPAVPSWSLPSGISGAKIAPGSLGAGQLGDNIIAARHVQAGSINAQAINAESLTADTAVVRVLNAAALAAVTAHIGALTAGTITTDELVASVAHMLNLTAANISAQGIQADQLAAQLADIAVLCAGTGSFDRATVRHLVANAMNLEYGVGDTVSITNLRVAYAQMASAAIGNLCVKASNGSYYALDVGADGTVSATPATVTEEEIDAGQTDAGRVILGTDITAANLSTGNLLGTYALINAIDAARIDVDQLIARQAFIDRLNTSLITNNQIIRMEIGSAVDALEIGGRNLLRHTAAPEAGDIATTRAAISGDVITITPTTAAAHAKYKSGLTLGQLRGQTLTLSFDARELIDGAAYEGGQVRMYFGVQTADRTGVVFGESYDAYSRLYVDGEGEAWHRYSYTASIPDDLTQGKTSILEDEGADALLLGVQIGRPARTCPLEVRRFKLEKGNKATDWTAAPEDGEAATAAAQTAADNAASAAATAQGTADSAASAASAAQTTADGAASAASTAQGTADSAVTAAATAQGTADSAVTAAATAQGTADSAASAASAAQGTADSAVTAAATAQSTAEAAQDSVDNLEIGGRNLLLHTAEPEAEDIATTRASLSGDVITITPTTAAAYAKYKSGLTLGQLRGRTMTLSFDAREMIDGATYGSGQVYMYYGVQTTDRVDVIFGSGYDAYSRLYVANKGSEWSRYSYTVTIPDDLTQGKTSILEDEGADALVLAVEIGRPARTCPLEVRRIKLEFGDKPTDWTAAPEDGEAATAAAQSAADRAQETADDALETTTQLTRYIAITADEGMRQGVPGSTYSTLVDEVGFHIEQSGEKIASFYKRQLAVEEVRVGALRATPCIVQRRSADGGLVFIPEV